MPPTVGVQVALRASSQEIVVRAPPERTVHTPAKANPRADASDSRPIGAVRPAADQNAVDVALVIVVLAFVVGLTMVAASLAPLDRAANLALTSRHARIAQGSAASRDSAWGMAHTQPSPRSADLAGTREPEGFAPATTTGPRTSPLFPQNGVTLWDRIRVSSKRDRRAFLLGTAIQIHAPATAAIPGPHFAPPPCCPRAREGRITADPTQVQGPVSFSRLSRIPLRTHSPCNWSETR